MILLHFRKGQNVSRER